MSETQKPATNRFPVEDYEKVFTRAFPEDNLTDPILGERDDVEIAPNFAALIDDPEVILAELEQDGKLVGFSLAMPVGKMDPEREDESPETAYIYYTGLEPDEQGQGQVGPLNREMERKLREHGYAYFEEDCIIANGYAAAVQKNYADDIVDSYDHTKFPEFGSQRHFRISLEKLGGEQSDHTE